MIKSLKEINNEQEEELPFFAKSGYLKSLSNDYGWLSTDKFLIPFIAKKKYIFKSITITNETIYLTKERNIDDETKFLNAVIEYLKKNKYDFITQSPSNVVFKAYPKKSTYTEFGTYFINLENDTDIIFKNIQSRRRRYINEAVKEGAIVEKGEHLKDICYEIISETHKKEGLYFFSKDEFNRFIFNSEKNIELFAVSLNGNYEGAVVMPFDKNTAYSLYGGSRQNSHNGSLSLLYWEAMKHFKSLNLKEYNFVGARINPNPDSKIYNIQKFKEKFGCDLRKGYLWKTSLNPSKKALFDLLVFLKTGKRNKDIIDQESGK